MIVNYIKRATGIHFIHHSLQRKLICKQEFILLNMFFANANKIPVKQNFWILEKNTWIWNTITAFRMSLRLRNYWETIKIIITYPIASQNWDGSSHYNVVIMSAMASQITSPTILYSTADSENIKAPRHWPLSWKFTYDRGISRTKGQ